MVTAGLAIQVIAGPTAYCGGSSHLHLLHRPAHRLAAPIMVDSRLAILTGVKRDVRKLL